MDSRRLPSSIRCTHVFDCKSCQMFLTRSLKLFQLKFPTKIQNHVLVLITKTISFLPTAFIFSQTSNSGVPQGSALGTALFMLYMNNISSPQDPRVINGLCADDTAMLVTSRSPLLHDQTRKIINYSHIWGFCINQPRENWSRSFTTDVQN